MRFHEALFKEALPERDALEPAHVVSNNMQQLLDSSKKIEGFLIVILVLLAAWIGVSEETRTVIILAALMSGVGLVLWLYRRLQFNVRK